MTIVSATDHRPLGGATLTIVDDKDAWNESRATLTTPPFATTDKDGLIRWIDLRLGAHTVLVRAPGHSPRAFDGDWQASSTIELSRSAVLTVTVLDQWGRPTSDAKCVLAMNPRHALGLSEVPSSGIGHPLSKNPLWSGTSDALGRVVFDELPPARYFLTVMHDEYFTLTDVGANSPVDVQRETSLTVSLQEPFGVAFTCPSKSPVRSVAWGVDTARLDTSSWVQSRVGVLRQKFAERMNGSLVYLHRLAHAEASCEVRCSVILEDGTAWRGAWPMRPISEVAEPVFLEQVAGGSRECAIRIKDLAGRELRGVRLSVRRKSDNFRAHASTGDVFHVPDGEYSIMPVGNPPAHSVLDAITATELLITASSPPEHVIQLATKVTELIVIPRLPTPELLGPLSFAVTLPDGQRLNRVNWRPEHGPVRFLVDQDRFALRVGSVFYEAVELLDQVLPASNAEPIVLKVGIVAKSSR